MKDVMVLYLLLLALVYLSSETSPTTPHHTFQSETSLLSLIKDRPKHYDSKAGKVFRAAFERHPIIAKLETFNEEDDFLKHTIDLRSFIKDKGTKAKVKFRAAISQYMKDKHHSSSLQNRVSAHLTKMAQLEKDRISDKKRRTANLEAYAAQKKLANANRRANLKRKQTDRRAYDEFEERMRNLNLPQNANAWQIEEAARGMVVSSSHFTTGRLRDYLKERFHPNVVKEVMINRTHYLAVQSNIKTVQRRKMQKMQGEMQITHGEDSQERTEHHQEPSSSSQVDIDPMSKQFHDTEWWNSMYHN